MNFGTLQQGSGTQDLQYAIENLPEAYRAGLALNQVTMLFDSGNAFSTDATDFTDLSAGSTSNLFDMYLNTSQAGTFSGQYQFNLSDEQDLSGWAGQQTLTLNVTATVVPEPTTLVLVGGSMLGLLAGAVQYRLEKEPRIIRITRIAESQHENRACRLGSRQTGGDGRVVC